MRGAETQISPERSEKPSFISRIHIMLNSVCKKWRERSEHKASWCNFVAVVTLNDEEFTNLLQLRGMMCFLTLWKSLSINYNIKWNLSRFFFMSSPLSLILDHLYFLVFNTMFPAFLLILLVVTAVNSGTQGQTVNLLDLLIFIRYSYSIASTVRNVLQL